MVHRGRFVSNLPRALVMGGKKRDPGDEVPFASCQNRSGHCYFNVLLCLN